MKPVIGVRSIALFIGTIAGLCALSPEAAADALGGNLPVVWNTATALTLSLLAALGSNQR